MKEYGDVPSYDLQHFVDIGKNLSESNSSLSRFYNMNLAEAKRTNKKKTKVCRTKSETNY